MGSIGTRYRTEGESVRHPEQQLTEERAKRAQLSDKIESFGSESREEFQKLKERADRTEFLLKEILKGMNYIEDEQDIEDYLDFLDKKRRQKEDEAAEHTKQLNEEEWKKHKKSCRDCSTGENRTDVHRDILKHI